MASASLNPPKEPLPHRLQDNLHDLAPWKISDRIWGQMQSQTSGKFKKVEVLPSDPEWPFVWRYFHHDKPTRFDIGRIYCVREHHQVQAFEFNLSSQEREAESEVFKPDWQSEPRADQRAQAMERFEKLSGPFSPFDTVEYKDSTLTRRRTWSKAKVLPLWHGSRGEVCESIAELGFSFFGKTSLDDTGTTSSTDDGFFGSGIYFTNSARYAGDIYSSGHLFMAWVSMREPFPVVGDPNQLDMKVLRSRGAHKKYNAHYIPVRPSRNDPLCQLYYPCKPGEEAFCDEFVVFQKTQALPHIWVQLRTSILHLIQPGHDEPQHVEDLIPHILGMLQNPEVYKDKKVRNALNSALEKLLGLPGDEYLEDHGFEYMYAQLQQLLVAGKVDRKVAKMLTSSKVPAISEAVVGASAAAAAAAAGSDYVEQEQPEVQAQSKPQSMPSPEQKKKARRVKSSSTLSKAFNKIAKIFITESQLASAAAFSTKTAKSPAGSVGGATVTTDAAASASGNLPEIAFGAAKWARYFGDVGEEPPIPDSLFRALKEPCPFVSGKRVEETHLLTLIPATVDGKPLTLDLLRELIKAPKGGGHATDYQYYSPHIKKEHGQKAVEKSYWALMTREIFDGTHLKSYSTCLKVLKERRGSRPYEAPKLIEAVTGVLMNYVEKEERLLPGNPLRYTYCQEIINKGKRRTCIGSFGGPGLSVFNHVSCGSLAPLRKFPVPPQPEPKPKLAPEQAATAIQPQAAAAAVQSVALTSKVSSSLPSIAFGAVKWARYFGDVGVEPPIPDSLLRALKEPCPFVKGKRVEETHLLTLIPAKVSGKPLTLDLLEGLIRSPKGGGHATKYRYYNPNIKKELGWKAVKKSYWALMTREILEGTHLENYSTCLKVLEERRGSRPYEVPKLMEAVTGVLMNYIEKEKRLLPDDPSTYTFCQEKANGFRAQTCIGYFGAPGLGVSYGRVDGNFGGLAPLRKL